MNNLIPKKWENKFNIMYLIFSIVSVLLWYIGSLNGESWLGAYVFIQFGGMLTLIYIAIKGSNKEFNKSIIKVLLLYVIAKLFEHYDLQFFELTNEIFSGHTLKHVISAIALYVWFPKEQNEKCITRKTFNIGFWQLYNQRG